MKLVFRHHSGLCKNPQLDTIHFDTLNKAPSRIEGMPQNIEICTQSIHRKAESLHHRTPHQRLPHRQILVDIPFIRIPTIKLTRQTFAFNTLGAIYVA